MRFGILSHFSWEKFMRFDVFDRVHSQMQQRTVLYLLHVSAPGPHNHPSGIEKACKFPKSRMHIYGSGHVCLCVPVCANPCVCMSS